MATKSDTIVKEYVRNLSDENLNYLFEYFIHRSADMGEILDFMSKNRDLDGVLSSTNGSMDLFEIIDAIEENVKKEASIRKNLKK